MTVFRQFLLLSAIAALPLLFALTATAATTPTVKASQNADVGKKILVDGKGRTVYILKPETKSKLLCKNSACIAAWPLVTVRSAKAKLVKGTGVSGKLGILKRGRKYQVTLGGKPLYRYAADSKGRATGEGIKSFGGTWLTLEVSGKSSTPPPNTDSPVVGY